MIPSQPAMAPARPPGNLQDMYTTTAPRVRDQPAAYGPHEVGAEPYPAATVLKDLARAPADHVPRILARYAALRCWLLRDQAADPGLVRHAARTARAYLAVVDGEAEKEPLERLLGPEPELAAPWDAAAAAGAAGHIEGAFALLRAGYMAARRRSEVRWAARLAGAIAELLEREGMDGGDLWARRARRLERWADAG